MNSHVPGRVSIAVLALIVSIISASFTFVTLYYGHLRRAHFVVSIGNYIYVQGRPRIAIPVSFFNDGARADVINAGGLTLSDGSNSFRFRIALLSPFPEALSDEDQKGAPVPKIPSLFSQVAVKGGDTAEAVFWYSPELSDFKFRPETDYSASLLFSRRGSEDAQSPLVEEDVCSASVRFHVTKLTADNAIGNSEAVIPVPTNWYRRP
jgi:hypothetical protein